VLVVVIDRVVRGWAIAACLGFDDSGICGSCNECSDFVRHRFRARVYVKLEKGIKKRRVYRKTHLDIRSLQTLLPRRPTKHSPQSPTQPTSHLAMHPLRLFPALPLFLPPTTLAAPLCSLGTMRSSPPAYSISVR